jgi:hypothetical protein
MKKYLLFLFSLMVLAPAVKATHLMGGEITASQLTDSTYVVKLTVYRDTLGIPMDLVASFEVRDTSGAVIMTFSTPQDSVNSGILLPLYPYGVEVYCFQDTIVLPGEGTYHIGLSDCCRNAAILNMTAPLTENMYLTTTVTYFSTATNSTPFFLVRPVIFLPVNTPWSYNPLPFDPDGDSLVYRIDTPLTAHQTNVIGYVTPSATAGGAFTIDPVTSTISWTANAIGNYDATVLTEEYRNGVKIGEIRRDMQFIVVAPTSKMPVFTNLNQIPLNSTGNFHIGLVAGEHYEFSFYAEDEDSSNTVTLEAFGEPFLFSQNYAKFSTQPTGKSYGNEVEGVFEWVPTESMVRRKPYFVVYRVSDGIFANDVTVLYNVFAEGAVGIDHFNGMINGVGEIYPNPAQSVLNIPMNLSKTKRIRIQVFAINGALMADFGEQQLPVGRQLLQSELELPSGTYILSLTSDNELINSQTFVVSSE